MPDNDAMIIEGCIEKYKAKNLPSDMASYLVFDIFCTSQVVKDLEIDPLEIEDSVVDGSNDGGIDGFIILNNDRYIGSLDDIDDIDFSRESKIKLLVLQNKGTDRFQESPIDKLHVSMPVIFDLSLNEDELLKRFNYKLVEKIMIFRKAWQEAIENNSAILILYFYITKGNTSNISSASKLKADQILNLTKEMVSGSNTNFEFIGAKKLLEYYKKALSTNLDLELKETPTPVTFYGSEDYGFIGVVSIRNYLKFIKDDDDNIRENIFETNIRHHQGNVEVNKKIAYSLMEDKKIDFWWLNNGITIIASGYRQRAKKVYLEDVQIVNGLQTSFTIFNKLNSDDSDDRSLLIKVIITQDKETTDKIISATNSQTYVSPASLRATDDIQRNLEIYFLNKGYYYDRRKNYYKNKGMSSRKIISIQKLAQCIYSIVYNDPASARNKPTALLKDDKTYNMIFNNDINFDVYFNCFIILIKCDDFIRNLSPDDKDIVQIFSLHLARVLTSVLFQKANYSVHDLEKMATEINEDQLNYALKILSASINDYELLNPSENIINIAKSKKFVIHLGNFLKKWFDDLS